MDFRDRGRKREKRRSVVSLTGDRTRNLSLFGMTFQTTEPPSLGCTSTFKQCEAVLTLFKHCVSLNNNVLFIGLI